MGCGTPEPFPCSRGNCSEKGIEDGQEISQGRERRRHEGRRDLSGTVLQSGIHSVHLGHAATCVGTGCRGTHRRLGGNWVQRVEAVSRVAHRGPFAPAGKQFECPLVQLVESRFGGSLFELDVAEPAFDRELVPHDFFLIGKVLFLLPGPGKGRSLSLVSVKSHPILGLSPKL